jgi:eukaryotic-like serine/threonine-protein kinase
VLDFGIAKLSGSTVETETGVIKGKLRYMPPEQIAGEAVDRRADVFAVGVMLWEALSGTKLWKGLSDATIMNRVLSGEIPKPDNAAGPIPPELVAICVRALAPERENRFQTALELELAIEEYLAKRSHYASARELGKFMTERFATVRAAVDRRIEDELMDGESSRPPAGGSILPRAATPSRTGYTASRSNPSEPPRSKLWLYAVASVAVGLAILLWGVRDKPEHAAGSASASTPVPRLVNVAIEARPQTARITVDGQQVSNPYTAQRVWDNQPHSVVVSAPGYASEETVARFDRDVRMFRALSPLPSSTSSAATGASSGSAPAPFASAHARSNPHVGAPVASSPPAASASAAAQASCDPPYFLDARGIKKFKPQCL